MVFECCVKGCGTVAKNGLHSFPSNKSVAEKWIMAIKAFHLMDRLNTKGLSHSFHKICKKHFKDSDMKLNGKGQCVVKPNSIPSLLLPDTDVSRKQLTLFLVDLFISNSLKHRITQMSLKLQKPVKRLQRHSKSYVSYYSDSITTPF